MEYNNYYPAQTGHPPPPVSNQQHGGPQMQQQPPPGSQMMHAPMHPQNIRQAMPSGPPNHHHQMQQQPQQHLGHHAQQMPPQQHPNYHQIQQTHPHGPPVSHSGSPHPQQQQHHNHQPNMTVPPPQQPSHHMHPQSPHHHAGQPMHIQQQQQQQQQQHHHQQQQQLNQMVRPPMGPSVMNHPQNAMQQAPPHHHQPNFFSGGPIPQTNIHHYPQQNQHHPNHQLPHHPHHNQQPMMHHSIPSHHPHIQQGIGRNSPYYPNILQTEFRIIELNRRLQSRPTGLQNSPLPSSYDDSRWWEKLAQDFFEDDATLTLRIQDEKPIEYTIGRTLIPRFFRACFDNGGVTDLSINLRNPKEACLHPQMITLDCDQAFIVTSNIYKHPALVTNKGTVVHTEGHLILDFVSNNFDTLLIKSWKFFTRGCREYIDRSMTAMGLPNQFLSEPVTKQGLSKSTIFYLKMCKIIEPMQDLMFLHKQTKMSARECLKKLLADKYKVRLPDDNRAATNKRRKRKPSAAPAITGTTATKKSKANVNNSIGNNSGLNNNIMMSPSGAPSFSLASQDVMVVGEPSMMGGDFGDDNERMITRLENSQYDPTASNPSNMDSSDVMNAATGMDHSLSINSNNNNIDNNVDSRIENHNLSPSLLQQRQQQQLDQQQQSHSQPPIQMMTQSNQHDTTSPQGFEQQHQRLHLNIQDQSHEDQLQQANQLHQINLIEQTDIHSQEELDAASQQPVNDQGESETTRDEDLARETNNKPLQHELNEDTKVDSVVETTSDSNLMLGVNSIERLENHTNDIQTMNEESSSSSQLPCSTASATPALEQQQPVDNGVA